MTDKELLELAAKAAGIDGTYENNFGFDGIIAREVGCSDFPWNPLRNDGQALRLAVKLGISTLPYPVYKQDDRHSVVAKQRRSGDLMRESNPTEVIELYNNDPYAATRRAIVRAAAEIGKGMK